MDTNRCSPTTWRDFIEYRGILGKAKYLIFNSSYFVAYLNKTLTALHNK